MASDPAAVVKSGANVSGPATQDESTLAPVSKLEVLRDVTVGAKGSALTNFFIFLDVVFSAISIIVFPIALIRATYNKVHYGHFQLGWLFTAWAATHAKGTRAKGAPPSAGGPAPSRPAAGSAATGPQGYGVMQPYLDAFGLKHHGGSKMVLRDCGDGEGTQGCLFASVLANRSGGSPRASKAECSALRGEHVDFVYKLYRDAMRRSAVSKKEQEIIAFLIKKMEAGENEGPLTGAMEANLSAIVAEHEKRLSIGTDREQTVAVTPSEEEKGQYDIGYELYFSGLAAASSGDSSWTSPDPSEVQRFKGYSDARAQCQGKDVNAMRGMWQRARVRVLAYNHIAAKTEGRTDSVKGALAALKSLPKSGTGEQNYSLLLTALFLLNYEVLLGNTRFYSVHTSDLGDVDSLRNELKLPSGLPFPPCIQAFFHAVRRSGREGYAAEMPDVAFCALREKRDILVYSCAGATGIQFFGKDGSFEAPNPDDMEADSILLHHNGGHFQTFLPESP
ncbi:MAG: hypothetical protein LBF24_03170 [Puniceicoccales bacterium]|jgi:hypothetical protein|nr:hypothetical protein [Puniceicoccales bacterium]